jgi:hypothetical protein
MTFAFEGMLVLVESAIPNSFLPHLEIRFEVEKIISQGFIA